jgi:hypothetical protein
VNWTLVLLIVVTALYLLQPYLDLRVLRKALGLTFFLELFYLVGYYSAQWPFPTPIVMIQIAIVVGLGMALGVIFARIWPLAPQQGFERVIRTLLLVIPSLGLGMGLQVLMQGNQATQAIYLIFALSSWLGSGHFTRRLVNHGFGQ